MKKIFVSIAAAGVLVVGAFAASTVIESPALAQTAVPTAVESDDATTDARPNFARPNDMLDEILGDLVSDGTLDQGEADAVKAALEARHEEVRAEMEAWREENPGRFERSLKRGFRMGGLLEDGVIDADELAELPDDHPLKDTDGPASEYLADGQLTEDELKQMGDQFRQRRAGARGASTDA
ncbi:MAG: hypothetical protein WCC01_04860 [Acidimicrobiia bacterium]